jgi:hypothetical protein
VWALKEANLLVRVRLERHHVVRVGEHRLQHILVDGVEARGIRRELGERSRRRERARRGGPVHADALALEVGQQLVGRGRVRHRVVKEVKL